MKLLVLYFNDDTKDQKWELYYGDHKEASKEAAYFLEKGYREVHRVWISTCFVDSLEEG